MLKNKTAEEIDNELKISQEIGVKQLPKVIITKVLKPYNGQTIYEVDYLNKVIMPAKIIKPTIVNLLTWKKDLDVWEVFEREHCVYVSCLNMKNAIKHAKKLLPGEDFSQYLLTKDNTQSDSNLTIKIKKNSSNDTTKIKK